MIRLKRYSTKQLGVIKRKMEEGVEGDVSPSLGQHPQTPIPTVISNHLLTQADDEMGRWGQLDVVQQPPTAGVSPRHSSRPHRCT